MRIKARTSGNPTIAEYRYDGLGQRNGWHYDINASGTVDSSDPWVWFVHDDRWRQVATFRGGDTSPKERFVHHNAGLDGFGGSSYIDSVILADRNQMNGTTDTPWADAAADTTCETRTCLLQNWRADTSVLMKATSGGGVVLQRIKYSPYGTPEHLFGIQAFNKDGFVEFTDFDDFVAAFENGEPSSDVNQDGFLDFSDFDAFQGAFEDTSVSDGGREIRKLWAGYEVETTDGARGLYHVRHRVYVMELGAWSSRDAMEYSDGASLYLYATGKPIEKSDPSGLLSATAIPIGPPSVLPLCLGIACSQPIIAACAVGAAVAMGNAVYDQPDNPRQICTKSQGKCMNRVVGAECKSGTKSSWDTKEEPNITCRQLRERLQNAERCAAARLSMNRYCFGTDNDPTHVQKHNEALGVAMKVQRGLIDKGCVNPKKDRRGFTVPEVDERIRTGARKMWRNFCRDASPSSPGPKW